MPVEPNNKARLYNDTGNAANTNVLASNLTASESPLVWDLWAHVNTSTVMSVQEWDGSFLANHTLNDGAQIDGGELYRFPVAVTEDNEYNVRFDQDVDVRLLQIDERGYYKG